MNTSRAKGAWFQPVVLPLDLVENRTPVFIIVRVRTSLRRAPINLGGPRRFDLRLSAVECCRQTDGSRW
jgi:hypothetical protein